MSGKEPKESKNLYRRSRLQIIFAVTLMGVMAVSIISPVLPEVRGYFGVTKSEVGLLITAFTFPGVFLSFFIGVLTDRFGRLQVLIPSLFLFGGAGGLCAVSPNFATLVTLRFFQGIGGAGLVMIATTLIGDYYDGVERPGAMGANASVLSMGTASYPFIGGFLGGFSWAAPFLFFLLAIPVGIVALLYLPNPETSRTSLGAYMSQVKELVARPQLIVGVAAGALAFVMLYGAILTFFPQLASDKFYLPSVWIGALMGSRSAVVALVSSQAGRLVDRFSKVPLILGGFVAYGAALLIIPLVPSAWMFLAPMFIFGAGHGLVVPSLQTHFSELAPRENRAASMSLFNTFTRTGMTVGPLLLGIALATGGYLLVFLSAGTVSLLAGIIGTVIVRLRSEQRFIHF